MRLTKHGHACVSIETGSVRLLVDPGYLTPDASSLIERANAVLITHEHADHVDVDVVTAALAARPELRVFGPSGVVGRWADLGERMVAVTPGDAFAVGEVEVTVHGGTHAEIHPDVPRPANVGYLIGGRVFHPGDSVEPPDIAVEALLVPASGPWFRVAGAIDLVRAVRPARAIAIHDAHASPVGLGLVARMVESLGGTVLEVLAPGESVELGEG